MKIYNEYKLPPDNLEQKVEKQPLEYPENTILILKEAINDEVLRVLSDFYAQEVCIKEMSRLPGVSTKINKNDQALVTYIVDSEEKQALIKSHNFSRKTENDWYSAGKEYFTREKSFLQRFHQLGCSTPAYFGSFKFCDYEFILMKYYRGLVLDEHIKNLTKREEGMGLLHQIAYSLAKFQIRATLDADALENELGTQTMESLKMQEFTVDALTSYWKSKLHSRISNNLGINLELDEIDTDIIEILAIAKRYAVHRDILPRNIIYTGRNDDNNGSSFVFIDLESVSIPASGKKTGGPIALDLGFLLTWPLLDMPHLFSFDGYMCPFPTEIISPIINTYINSVNEELKTTEQIQRYKIELNKEFMFQVMSAMYLAFSTRIRNYAHEFHSTRTSDKEMLNASAGASTMKSILWPLIQREVKHLSEEEITALYLAHQMEMMKRIKEL